METAKENRHLGHSFDGRERRKRHIRGEGISGGAVKRGETQEEGRRRKNTFGEEEEQEIDKTRKKA